MMLALFLLTVSTTFACAFQHKMPKLEMENHQAPLNTGDEDNSNPIGNSTEEKAVSSNSFSEEYLHNHPQVNYIFSEGAQFYKLKNSETYIAFHGELLVHPPNKA